uniref:Uncharacterized protein n=1 Tax=Chromera velia CCMP2878 TaxID=1169474 RepID=A0A0G4ICW6_9ALVE|eukprot:Cvel_13174.t1-p1 / transcript=Cvel_13174.t1 / gene=Cvel_13174 / organism=Chromera_velia_CCMP2878 / gene_product=hypothetical protein / transcript_product=hypothetical protein / location=Cvel_scaffold889:62741-63786(-) / protein_length=101 / sequence_SO=supercontig / SO=protein_coding / is_pseudo=false
MASLTAPEAPPEVKEVCEDTGVRRPIANRPIAFPNGGAAELVLHLAAAWSALWTPTTAGPSAQYSRHPLQRGGLPSWQRSLPPLTLSDASGQYSCQKCFRE